MRRSSVGDSVVVAGGEDGAQTVPEVDRLDLRTGSWGALADLPVARHGLGVVADGPLVFTIDGGPAAGLDLLAESSRGLARFAREPAPHRTTSAVVEQTLQRPEQPPRAT